MGNDTQKRSREVIQGYISLNTLHLAEYENERDEANKLIRHYEQELERLQKELDDG